MLAFSVETNYKTRKKKLSEIHKDIPLCICERVCVLIVTIFHFNQFSIDCYLRVIMLQF